MVTWQIEKRIRLFKKRERQKRKEAAAVGSHTGQLWVCRHGGASCGWGRTSGLCPPLGEALCFPFRTSLVEKPLFGARSRGSPSAELSSHFSPHTVPGGPSAWGGVHSWMCPFLGPWPCFHPSHLIWEGDRTSLSLACFPNLPMFS